MQACAKKLHIINLFFFSWWRCFLFFCGPRIMVAFCFLIMEKTGRSSVLNWLLEVRVGICFMLCFCFKQSSKAGTILHHSKSLLGSSNSCNSQRPFHGVACLWPSLSFAKFDALPDALTGREVLTLYARLRGIPEGRVSRVVKDILARLNLDKWAGRGCGTYRSVRESNIGHFLCQSQCFF